MSREIIASAVLGPEQFNLLALHRHVPERGLMELIERSQRGGDPVRLSLFHLNGCDLCARDILVDQGRLCDRGARLVAACAGWRDRSAA